MTTTSIRRWRRRAAVLGAGAMIALVPAAAHAVTIGVDYDVTGTSLIASTDSTINLGPATLSTDIDANTGNFTGSMPLPGTTTRFEVIGLIPVTAKVDFVEAAPVTGHIKLFGLDASIESTASYYIKLSNIKIVGFPTFTGSHCRTKVPVSIPANTPAGENFHLTQGGNLEGEYTIGDFEHCGLNTWLINLLVPGSGNTVDLQVTNGVIG
ncbi:hypothetical protein [Aeromicrobium sp. UC242_57]|uniref:hypothetical protein n=1 Tax=Aeromicrobium sp. UC242_57 TaxID=3374624 RepID=UPI00379A4BA2